MWGDMKKYWQTKKRKVQAIELGVGEVSFVKRLNRKENLIRDFWPH